MTDKVQKIREEVEKLKSQLLRGVCSSQIAMETRCKEEAYNEVLAILDSMQKESISENLEEAANDALNNVLNTHEIVNVRSCLEMFKYGAQWKEKEMQSTIELAEDHAMFAGMEKMKENMMAKTIDGEILEAEDNDCAMCSYTHLELYIEPGTLEKSGFKDNDKVKVIIIKED